MDTSVVRRYGLGVDTAVRENDNGSEPDVFQNVDEEEEVVTGNLFPSARAPEISEKPGIEFIACGNGDFNHDNHCEQVDKSIVSKKKSDAKRKVPVRRRMKLDPEAEKQRSLIEREKTKANGLVQKALIDERGADREFELPAEKCFDNNVSMEVLPGSRLRNEVLEDLLVLTRVNMKSLYDGAGSPTWSWSDSRKRGELRNERMRWILLRSKNDEHGIETLESDEKGIIGFVAFRFTAEVGIPHTYVHEVQIAESMRARGYGQLLMRAVQYLSEQVEMQLIILTVFSDNLAAVRFYNKIGFTIDEASPGPCYNILGDGENKSPYEIMSKVLDESVLAYGCEKCSYRCRFQDTLIQHAGFVHNKPWPHPCRYEGCQGGTVHFHQLQKHIQLKHTKDISAMGAAESAVDSDFNYTHARVTFKTDGRRGTVIKLGEKGFYTVRMDGPTLETIVCRAASFVGHHSQPVKKKVIDPDHEFALKLQYEDGWARKSSRSKKSG